MNTTVRIVFVDMLRGVCAIYIVAFWHLMNYTSAFRGYYNPITLRITVVVLGLFVFLSGWSLGQLYIEASTGGLTRFYVDRFVRIYPLYLGAIGLFALFNLADSTSLLKAALMMSMFSGPTAPTLWFVAMLLLFYLVARFSYIHPGRDASSGL